jgi:cytidylate kinase
MLFVMESRGIKSRVVTVSHATGAGGAAIAHAVATKLGFRYIDEDIIAVAAQREGVDAALVADTERRKTFVERLISGIAQAVSPAAIGGGTLVPDTVMPDTSLRTLIVDAIRETADRGNVVIVSHGASIPLAGRPDTLRVLITASVETRVRRVAEARVEADPAAFIDDNDVARADYFARFYGIDQELPTHYDLVLNTDALSSAEAADIVVAAARRSAR